MGLGASTGGVGGVVSSAVVRGVSDDIEVEMLWTLEVRVSSLEERAASWSTELACCTRVATIERMLCRFSSGTEHILAEEDFGSDIS